MYDYEVEDEEVVSYDETGYITGFARYKCEIGNGDDTDVGGTKGPECLSATLYSFVVGGLCLSREQIVLVAGEEEVSIMEYDAMVAVDEKGLYQ